MFLITYMQVQAETSVGKGPLSTPVYRVTQEGSKYDTGGSGSRHKEGYTVKQGKHCPKNSLVNLYVWRSPLDPPMV